LKRFIVIVFPLLLGACTLIDDDLSVCDEELFINYQVQLHTELSMQLEAELVSETETPVRKALEKWLSPIFTDRAKDIDLRFFSGDEDEIRYQIQEVINDNRTSYTIVLPKEDYMHLAVANIADDRQVHLLEGAHSRTMMLRLSEEEVLAPLTTGVFTARLPMQVDETSQRFDVRMYMVTSAVALIVDTTSCPELVGLEGYMMGSACGFSLRDSAFAYDNKCRMMMEEVEIESQVQKAKSQSPITNYQSPITNNPYSCYGTVCFPTRDEGKWTVSMRATLTDNRHTTTTLTIDDPLKAGTLRIIRCVVDEKGKLEPDEEHDADVGAAVELDWNDGTIIDIEL